MTGSFARQTLIDIEIIVFIGTLLLADTAGAAGPSRETSPATLLAEARTAASNIQDPNQRASAVEQLLLAQIRLDPTGARETLKLFPKLPNRLNHFASLASVYAKTGNIEETERMYAEIRLEDRSAQRGKLAAAEARGYLAMANANAGKFEDAFHIVSQIRDQFRENPPAIVGTALAEIAAAQARAMDIPGAVRTATVIAGENPYVLMNIVAGRVKAGDLERVQQIISGLDEGLQRYAQWGIVQAQKEQGRLTEAQLTASAIKPGHAKAGALLELANHHVKAGAKPMAAGLLQEAATAAGSTINEWARADVLWHIAAAMAEAGETFTALETAKAIEMDPHRKWAISGIAKVQAMRGDVKGAFNTALLIKRERNAERDVDDGYESAIGDILAELAKVGRAKEAWEAVRNFEDFGPRHRLLYARIAASQADAADIQGAKSTLLLLETDQQRSTRKKELLRLVQLPQEHLSEEDLRRLRELRDADYAVRLVLEAHAKAQARKGDLRSALMTADGLTNSSDRLRLLLDIGAIQVQTGRTQQALTWARALPSASDKAYALLGIAQAMTAIKSSPKTKN